MQTFHVNGTYCLRTERISNTICNLVEQWAKSEELLDKRRFTWITETPESTLEHRVWPLLSKRTSRLKGLDVVQILDSEKQGTLRDLCRMIESISPITPGIVFIERLEQWLSKTSSQLIQIDTAQQIHSLNQWCAKKRITLVALISDELPVWSTFMHGLSDLSEDGKSLLTPWWAMPWGYEGGLWHFEPDTDDRQILLDGQYYSTLGELGRDLYLLRLNTNEETSIHVKLAKWDKNSTEAVALLRLGADSVIKDLPLWKEMHPKSSEHLIIFDRSSLPEDTQLLDAFGVTLQEIITPGQLKFLPAQEFSVQGLMLSRMSSKWSVFCSLSRLSLLNHINAVQAAKLTNVLSMQCSVLATSEALYVFRMWESPPTETTINEYLETCFSIAVPSLFAGASHFMQEDTIRAVLKSLAGYEAAFVTELMEDSFANQASSLDDVWNDVQDTPEARPWIKRLANLAGISELMRGSQLHQEETR